jgi:hypothetical protein
MSEEHKPIHYSMSHRSGFVRLIVHAVGDCVAIFTTEEAEQFAADLLDSAAKSKIGQVQ